MGYVEGLLSKNEQIVVRTHRHWIVLASSFLTNLFIAVGVAFLAIALAVASSVLPILSLLLLIFPGIGFLRRFLEWWNEEYMVTNRRVIQAEGIINKHVIDSSLEKVNDVVLDQSYLGRLLDYGDIEILTASEIGVNKLHKIGHPVKFKTEMLNQKENLGQEDRSGVPSVPRREDVPGLIAELDELRKRGVLTEAEFQQKKAELLAKM
jgi:uncharacterized membrane protein YdbT with pleckstrin-like domain